MLKLKKKLIKSKFYLFQKKKLFKKFSREENLFNSDLFSDSSKIPSINKIENKEFLNFQNNIIKKKNDSNKNFDFKFNENDVESKKDWSNFNFDLKISAREKSIFEEYYFNLKYKKKFINFL